MKHALGRALPDQVVDQLQRLAQRLQVGPALAAVSSGLAADPAFKLRDHRTLRQLTAYLQGRLSTSQPPAPAVAVAEPPGAAPLLTRMCTPPSCAAAWATISSTCARLVTSVTRGTIRRPVRDTRDQEGGQQPERDREVHHVEREGEPTASAHGELL